jgi:chromosome partitioning protein
MVSIALYNLKGGVGKTAATVNLAYLAAADGLKTLVWDLDPQGSSSFYLNVQPTTKNESRKLLTDEIALKDAIQDCAFENLWAIPSDLSARNADVVLDEMKKSKKKLKNLISGLKEFELLFIHCFMKIFLMQPGGY